MFWRPKPIRAFEESSPALRPEDAKWAVGHGVRAKRSKSNAIGFEILEAETRHAAFQ